MLIGMGLLVPKEESGIKNNLIIHSELTDKVQPKFLSSFRTGWEVTIWEVVVMLVWLVLELNPGRKINYNYYKYKLKQNVPVSITNSVKLLSLIRSLNVGKGISVKVPF